MLPQAVSTHAFQVANALDTRYARKNLGDGVSIDLGDVVGTGSFKDVFRGTHRNGPRSNQPCVEKCVRPRPGAVSAKEMCENETAINDKRLYFVQQFNDPGLCAMKFHLNTSEVWNSKTRHGERCLMEPFIWSFENFNSNTGWVPASTVHRVLASQALSHFLYHTSTSGGTLLLYMSDLQGGKLNKGIALTDPVVVTIDRQFGPRILAGKACWRSSASVYAIELISVLQISLAETPRPWPSSKAASISCRLVKVYTYILARWMG